MNLGKTKQHHGKKGGVALLWVVLALVVIISFQGHVNILNQTSIVNEFQQQMDMAALNALNRTVDIDAMQREEELIGDMTREYFMENYEDDIKQAFNQELFSGFEVGGDIHQVSIMETTVDFVQDYYYEYISLDTVVRVTVNHYGNFETASQDATFDVGVDGNTKVYARRNEDGRVDLFLHNQTILQYESLPELL